MPARSDEYVSWAEFRYQLRLWMRLSEEAAREQGISPQQHQLLLAARGYPGPTAPLITDLAERLQLRHHSVVGLIDRMELDGLVRREEVGVGRGTSVLLTDAGLDALEAISATLRPELRTAAQALISALTELVEPRRRSPRSTQPHTAVATR
ncbi:MAG: MarR family transcriptional regulator [Chloroflexota bacterium]